MVIIPSPLGLDGADGHPRWAGDFPKISPWVSYNSILLDAGDSSRMPYFVTPVSGATVCRSALPTTPTGGYCVPQGAQVPPGLARDDPRWTRPLPWTIGRARDVVGSPLVAMAGLALFNVFLPLLILRLVALRRPWTMRLLMMLPVAAALPLTAFSVVEPLVPSIPSPYPASTKTVFFVGSLAGVPIVSFVATAGWILIQRRWRPFGATDRLERSGIAGHRIDLALDRRPVHARHRALRLVGLVSVAHRGRLHRGHVAHAGLRHPESLATQFFRRNATQLS